MGKDWYEPRDKGPSIEEPVNRHRKLRKGKKNFTIECRRRTDIDRPQWGWWLYQMLNVEWRVMSRYKTAKARDEAWKNLCKKNHGIMRNYYRMQEFRKGNP